MKKVNRKIKEGLRDEYKSEDFPDGFIRNKYVKRIKESSNIVVLKPEVAEVFPNKESVNSALLSLIRLANKTAQMTKQTAKRSKKSRFS